MRDGTTRLIAVTASVVLHGIWLVQSGDAPAARHPDVPVRTTVTRLTFAAPEPVLQKPAAQPEPVMESLPEPVQMAHNARPVISEKPKPVRKPKPVKKKQHVYKARRESKPVTEEIRQPSVPVEPVQVASAPAVAAPAPVIDEGLTEQEKQRYLADIMAHIEQHKWYPAAARRRGIQGAVKVAFLLMADGSVRHVEVEEGPKALRVAAEQAVISAEPMPMPPVDIHCPLRCEFSMRFALN